MVLLDLGVGDEQQEENVDGGDVLLEEPADRAQGDVRRVSGRVALALRVVERNEGQGAQPMRAAELERIAVSRMQRRGGSVSILHLVLGSDRVHHASRRDA